MADEVQQNAPQQLQVDSIHWFYAGWKAISGVIVVVGASAPTAVLGWDTMLPSGKFVAVMGLAVAAVKSLDMLFDTTMRRLAQGKTPLPLNGNGGHTQHFKKDVEAKP